MESSPVKGFGYALMFIVFILFATFAVMQQLLGIMCESAQVGATALLIKRWRYPPSGNCVLHLNDDSLCYHSPT